MIPRASKSSGHDMSYHCRLCNKFWISETRNQAREKLCGSCERQLKEYEEKAKNVVHTPDLAPNERYCRA